MSDTERLITQSEKALTKSNELLTYLVAKAIDELNKPWWQDAVEILGVLLPFAGLALSYYAISTTRKNHKELKQHESRTKFTFDTLVYPRAIEPVIEFYDDLYSNPIEPPSDDKSKKRLTRFFNDLNGFEFRFTLLDGLENGRELYDELGDILSKLQDDLLSSIDSHPDDKTIRPRIISQSQNEFFEAISEFHTSNLTKADN